MAITIVLKQVLSMQGKLLVLVFLLVIILDALAAVAFCLVATETLKKFGFQSKKEYLSTIWVVGIVTSVAFSILYIGLGFWEISFLSQQMSWLILILIRELTCCHKLLTIYLVPLAASS